MSLIRCFALILLFISGGVGASTWDEPWHEEVLRQADTLGLYEVTAIDADRIELRRLKTLAGAQTPDRVQVDGLYLLPDAHRHHNHGQDERLAWLQKGERAYLLLKRVGKGWQLPTPSAGSAGFMEDGRVAATYRASFHQAIQAADAYERVQSCLFLALHDGECDVAALSQDLDKPLREEPAGLGGEGTERFFRQHVALESAALLGRSIPLATLEPFLMLDDYHVQLSAVRALAANTEPGRNARLLEFVQDDSRQIAARVMAVRMAADLEDTELHSALKAYGPKAPQDEAGLAMSIMDPRVGTRFPPTLKAAISEL
jgi:hypothetical protein